MSLKRRLRAILNRSGMENEVFDRAELLLGADKMARLSRTRVILFGVGGVGSWCAEALVRTGVGHITIVDMDMVAPSNINRQLPATSLTVGRPKVEVLAERLREINPKCEIIARKERFCAETASDFPFDGYDYVIDAIDSVADKALLILRATETRGVKLFSSMGAARKLDPTRVQVAEFWSVKGCPLAAALRSRFKRQGVYPRRKFKCVFSDEVRPNGRPDGPNGSLMQITATWGMVLASLLISDIMSAE